MPVRPISTNTIRTFDGTLRHCLEAEARHRKLPLGAAAPDLSDHVGLRALFAGQAPLALLAFDTPGLQDYVFRVRRPIDVRGGSLQVREFARSDPGRPTKFDECLQSQGLGSRHVIYAGAGQGLLVTPAHVAAEACAAIENLLARQTHQDLRTVAAWLGVWPRDLGSDPAPALPAPLRDMLGHGRPASRYCATRGALATTLAQRRSQQARLAPPIPAARQEERCDACELNLGARQGDGTHVCAACTTRRTFGGHERRANDEARTFEDIVAGTGHTAMAVIYVDGANFGSLFRGVRSMEQHRSLSAAVEAAFEQAAQRARSASQQALVVKDDDIGDELRFQTPICGGDDLVLVLPAVVAPAVVETLLDSLEADLDPARNATLREAWPKDVAPIAPGIGVGLAIADTHFPVHFLLGYAKSLMQSAKAALRQAGGERSAVDFTVLTSGVPLGRTIQATREQYLWRAAQGNEPALRLTERPYTGTRFRDFLRYARALDSALVRGRAQVFALRQELLRGYHTSRNYWHYQHARASHEDAGWLAFRERLGCDLKHVDELLWRRTSAGDTWSTRYLDAVELLDFLRGAGSRAGAKEPSA